MQNLKSLNFSAGAMLSVRRVGLTTQPPSSLSSGTANPSGGLSAPAPGVSSSGVPGATAATGASSVSGLNAANAPGQTAQSAQSAVSSMSAATSGNAAGGVAVAGVGIAAISGISGLGGLVGPLGAGLTGLTGLTATPINSIKLEPSDLTVSSREPPSHPAGAPVQFDEDLIYWVHSVRLSINYQ